MTKTHPPETAAPVSSPPPPRQRNVAEWVTFAISLLVLVAIVTLVCYDWLLVKNRPPVLKVELDEGIAEIEEQYYQPFTIANSGGSIAESVQVTATLDIPGEAPEIGEQEIDLLSGGESKKGFFIFSHDPRHGHLRLRVASYKLP